MNNIKATLKSQPRSLIILGFTLALVLIIGLGLAAAIAIATIYDEKLHLLSVCLNSNCVNRLAKSIEAALATAKATLDFGVAIATIGGIFVALLSYLSTASNAALTNHIEHLKVFTEYIEAELEKRDRLSRSNFDLLLLYEKIFSQSRNGKTTVSEGYKNFLIALNTIITESNERCSVGTPGGFSYKDHQRRVREHLIQVGITVYTAPRNDYFEMENQLFSLLHRISQSFCPPGVLPDVCTRKYY